MRTAKEARELLAQSKTFITDTIEEIDRLIPVACQEGLDFVEYDLASENYGPPLQKALEKLGYNVSINRTFVTIGFDDTSEKPRYYSDMDFVRLLMEYERSTAQTSLKVGVFVYSTPEEIKNFLNEKAKA